MRPFIIAPLIVILGASPGWAQSVTDWIFAPGADCFGRTYDAAHLDSHPHQEVTQIVIFADVEDMELDSSDDRLLVVEVSTRSTKSYSGIAYCAATSNGMDFLMEGDAGGMSLSAQDGRLRLDVGPDGLSFEGDKDFLTLAPNSGDDRLFLLDQGQCG